MFVSAWRRVSKVLPRGQPVSHLYEYRVPEYLYQQHAAQLQVALAGRDVLGVYELQVPSLFRMLATLGCVAQVSTKHAREMKRSNGDTELFEISDLEFRTLAQYPYLESDPMSYIYLYHHNSNGKQFFGVFLPELKKGHVFVNDTVRTNQMPNLGTLYNNERNAFVEQVGDGQGDDRMLSSQSQLRASPQQMVPSEFIPEADYHFEVKIETDLQLIYRQISRILTNAKPQFKKPPALLIQSPAGKPV